MVFIKAFNIIKAEGWVAFNIKESFIYYSDESGLSTMNRDIYYIVRYRHRLSIEREPLYYRCRRSKKF